MINVSDDINAPMRVGQIKSFQIDGDGPFRVSSSCFIDKPSPPGPGFLPCAECATQVVRAGAKFDIELAENMWRGKEGHVEVEISNSMGELKIYQITVLRISISSTRTSTAKA